MQLLAPELRLVALKALEQLPRWDPEVGHLLQVQNRKEAIDT